MSELITIPIVLAVVSVLLIIMASMCSSVMDTVDHHQEKSIFSKFKNRKWWNQSQGWKNKYIDYDGDMARGVEPRLVQWKIFGFEFNKPVQLSDSWHFFKMLMIIFICLAVIISPIIILIMKCGSTQYFLLEFTLWLITLGLAWNKPFTWSYKYWFILKGHK